MHNAAMKTLKYVYWQEGGMWLGYLEEFPRVKRADLIRGGSAALIKS